MNSLLDLPMKHTTYQGALGQTTSRRLHLRCASCGCLFSAEVLRSVNLNEQQDLPAVLAAGRMNVATCSECGTASKVELPVVVHHAPLGLFGLIIPQGQRHLELQARIELLRELAADSADMPPYVVQPQVFFGSDELLNRLSQLSREPPSSERGLDSFDQRLLEIEQREAALLVREDDYESRLAQLVKDEQAVHQERSEYSAAAAAHLAAQRQLRLLSLELSSRELGDDRSDSWRWPTDTLAERGELDLSARPQAEVDRFRTGEQQTGHFVHEREVFLAARLSKRLLSAYREATPCLAAQLHFFGEQPLLVLLVLAPESLTGLEEATGVPALVWPLDPQSDDSAALVQRLQRDFTLHLDLYDEESRPICSWRLTAPLADNLGYLMGVVANATAEGKPADFDSAVDRFRADQARLSSFVGAVLPGGGEYFSPGAARLALGAVEHWGMPDNEELLIRLHSFPRARWLDVRDRVIGLATQHGLCPAGHLWPHIEGDSGEVLRAIAERSVALSSGHRVSDLSHSELCENWAKIVAECQRQGVTLPADHSRHASSVIAGGVSPGAPRDGGAVDHAARSSQDLLKLLREPDQRVDAALELCEREEELAAVAVALSDMSQPEILRVTTALMRYGPAAAEHLRDLLSHRRVVLRQIAAMALGASGERRSAQRICQQMLLEGSAVWRELARAAGDLGQSTASALRSLLSDVDEQATERCAWALAFALADETGAELAGPGAGAVVSVVDEFASGDPHLPLVRCAQRAQTLSSAARQDCERVRGLYWNESLNAFERLAWRFHVLLRAQLSEAEEGDIIDQEELLEDADIVDEEDVVLSG